jgi:hypothetical protein
MDARAGLDGADAGFPGGEQLCFEVGEACGPCRVGTRSDAFDLARHAHFHRFFDILMSSRPGNTGTRAAIVSESHSAR